MPLCRISSFANGHIIQERENAMLDELSLLWLILLISIIIIIIIHELAGDVK